MQLLPASKLLPSAAVLALTALVGASKWPSPPQAEAQEQTTLPLATLGAKPRIWFYEDFRNYGVTAPTLAADPGIDLDNDPIWTQTASANFRLEKSGTLLKEFTRGTLPANQTSYDVLFQFRLREIETKMGQFQLHLRSGAPGTTGDAILTFGAEQISLTSRDLKPELAATATLPTPIIKNIWHQAVVQVRHGQLTVHLDQQRVFHPVLRAKVPVQPAAGINFFAAAGSGFSLTNIQFREPGALPDYGVERLLPLPRTVDEAAFALGGSKTLPANDILGATLRTGPEKNGAKVTLAWENGKTQDITFTTIGIPEQRRVVKDGKAVNEKYERPDAIIQVRGLGDARSFLNLHVRPKLRRYHTSYSQTEFFHDIVRDWEKLPPASTHPLLVELRRTSTGVDVYLDGSLAASLVGTGLKEATFSTAPTGALGESFSRADAQKASPFVPLDLPTQGMAKSFAGAQVSLKPGLNQLGGVPIMVATGAQSADLGLTRMGQGNWALEVDEYTGRSAFDGFLSEVHFAVPGGAPYTKAYVLAAVDPDPAKDPIFTTRLTQYQENGIGGNRIADTTITLPRGTQKPEAGVQQVGTVSRTVNGLKQEIPLYMVEVPLDSGKILDLAQNGAPLNFEFFGKPWENFQQLNNSFKPDPRSTSAVQVFGVTLHKSPVGLEVVQAQPGNIFHNDEKPQIDAIIKGLAPAQGKLAWEVLDTAGNKVREGAINFRFAAAGTDQKVNIPLAMPELGWYQIQLSLEDNAGKTLVSHPASFVLLGQDNRKAKYESPYATWWFDGAHLTPKELEFAGPIMLKAGIRKASWTKQSEKAMEKWGITRPQITSHIKFDALTNPKALEKAEAAIRRDLENYPHVKEMLIFHESGPGNEVPMELIGLKPDNLTEARIKNEKRFADLVNMAGSFLREKFPQIKTVVGNNSASTSPIAAVLRHGGNPDYIDYIGIEAPTQVMPPEKLTEVGLQGHHMARETAKLLSGKDIPANGSYEFTYRCERDMGQQQQAEWYVRDVLISLAHNFTTISPGILFDTSNSYHDGLWGGSGLMERAPWGNPKRAYAAYAVVTNVLDQVKFRRQVPTGSSTVYALEFDRADHKLATALWAGRGEVDFVLEFSADTEVTVIDFYGRTRKLRTAAKKLTVRGGTAAVYLLATGPVNTITLGNRSFAKDAARASAAVVAAPLDGVAPFSIDTDSQLDSAKKFPLQIPIRQLGEVEARLVTDADKGVALELELKTTKTPELSKYITEYGTVRLATAAPIAGEPAAIGVWVKGNSNWGRALFEIEDAGAEVWRSIGTSGWGCDILDWPGNLAVNFDGWNFVALPFRDTKLFNDHSPGPVLEQWVSSGGDKKIDFPIKVRALTMEMNRMPLGLTSFTKATSSVRVKDISGIYEK